ncbi:hypothetical protein [Mycolicibacterium sp. P1-5]|uniref:hypothetical protein n=1 Tax=Mycolicibacterium sp. P1-5 TaxID=2024617 RepID=UPI0018836257|nr:hypothetical protein [Mycolicibacterium sp. P1-5]
MLQSYALTGVCACARNSLNFRQAALRAGARLNLAEAGRRVHDLSGRAGRHRSGRRDGDDGQRRRRRYGEREAACEGYALR